MCSRQSNSRLSASLASLSADGTTLTVDNPDGSLVFVKVFSAGDCMRCSWPTSPISR